MLGEAIFPRHPGASPDSVMLLCGKKSKWITRRILRIALRAIGSADVRSGIPASAVRVSRT
jgi:hypothetical protein